MHRQQTVTYEYAIGEKVNIIELDTDGIVIELVTARRGNEIKVRYCYNGKFEEVWFFESELKEAK